jgi:hypothetical protein
MWLLYITVIVILIAVHVMANVLISEFQKLLSNLTESLRLEYKNTTQHPDPDVVMKLVHGVLTAIARLAECTPVSRRKPEKDSNRPNYGKE